MIKQGLKAGVIICLTAAMSFQTGATCMAHSQDTKVEVGSAIGGESDREIILEAETLKENPKVGGIFKGENGNYEKIIRVEKDGTFMTVELNNEGTKSRKAACVHPASKLTAVAEELPDTKTVGSKNVCFKYRTKTKCRCGVCKAIVYTYGPWKNHTKHSFSVLGKTCKNCNYKK